jgi:signal transduction histidine kinase/CheY-like chemotaxis protein
LPRSIYEQGKDTEVFLMGSALALGLTFSLVTMFLLEKMVLSRLVGLGKNVEAIGARGDLGARLPIQGHDELTDVSHLINRMLASLQQVEQERRRQEERYRAYITQSTEGIWRCELQNALSISLPIEQQIQHLYQNLYFAECNEALARLHGFATPRDMEGKPLRDLFDISIPTNLELAKKFLDSGFSIADAESVELDEQGHTRYFVNNISGVIEQGMLVRIWGAQREVTHQRRLEAQLRQAQKMEAMGRLAGGVAHDFNNLLSVIHGYTEILQKRFRPEDPGYKEALHVLHATEKAAGLTNQLLAFGRKQVLAPRILDLNAVIRDLDRMVRKLIREDIDLVIRTEPNLWPVRADLGQMEQVIINLAVNAGDAIPSGGCITVETSNLDHRGGLVGQDPTLKPGRYVVLTVTDTGIGMDAETRGKIFEPFFTTKDVGKGTGLGLATVYGIVQQSGGQISVYSEPGRGSVFKIFLPQADGVIEPIVRPPRRQPVPRQSGTVLLVEDDPSVRQLAREVLEGRGYTVVTAASGNEALERVESQAASIDLVVTDVIMPGMAGDELVEHLRLRRPELKVVFVSGYASDSIPRIVPDLNTSFLQKPFPVEDLVRTVYEMIAGKRESQTERVSSRPGQTAS